MKPLIRILLTGAGSPAAPGVMRSLRLSREMDFFIAGMDCNPNASGLHMADRAVIGPRASEDRFMPFVMQLCMDERIDLIFSLVTEELIPLAEHREEFLKLGTRLLISSPDALHKAIHKGRLYQELAQMGIAVPEFRIADTPGSLRQAINELGYPGRPVCFKPAVSDGSRGFHILDAGFDKFRLLFHEKPNSAYMTVEELFRVIGGRTVLPETIVMEYLPHEEYSVDLLADNGRAVAAVPRLREATTGGITTKSVIADEPDIVDYAVTVVKKLGLNGNIGVQIRRDRNRAPKIVEINPRIQGTIVHCTAAGINFPLLAVKQAFGMAPSAEELTVKWGTRMTRYWEEVFYDADGSSYAL